MKKTGFMMLCAAAALLANQAVAETTVVHERIVEVPAAKSTVTTTTTPTTIETTTSTTTSSSKLTETAVVPAPLAPTTRALHIQDFDADRNGLLSRAEVGEMIFGLYDTDGNMVIDNNEFERPAVLTVAPMEKMTKITYDFDNDGMADKQEVTYERFMEYTQLSRFDKNNNGLSPHEFTGKAFNQVDVDDSKAIEKKEWQGVYNEAIDAKNRAEAALNK
ncbi:MAG TPA: hypothetical protein VEF76_09025 [Patescibacteria group bacterium]|nr:hypothetical protein [Patescibacteria group bacterium]